MYTNVYEKSYTSKLDETVKEGAWLILTSESGLLNVLAASLWIPQKKNQVNIIQSEQ